jgi:hypothetical protein
MYKLKSKSRSPELLRRNFLHVSCVNMEKPPYNTDIAGMRIYEVAATLLPLSNIW